jgi:multisubunit Na+/H+ antiporter MnhB subunit
MRHSAPSASRSRRQRRTGEPRRLRWQQLPYAIVLCGVALALVWMRQSGQDVRGGTLAVAGILFAAALARLALPERRAGMLASRRRLADVAVLTALGTGLLVAGLMLPAQH